MRCVVIMLNKTNILVIFILFTIGCVNLPGTTAENVEDSPTATIDIDATVMAMFEASNSKELRETIEVVPEVPNNQTSDAKGTPNIPVYFPKSTPSSLEDLILPTPTSIPSPPSRTNHSKTKIKIGTLVFGNGSQNQIRPVILSFILKWGYGYTVEFRTNSPWEALCNPMSLGQIDILLGLENPGPCSDLLDDSNLVSFGKSSEDFWQSDFVVFRKTLESNPGLVYASDLLKPEYQSLFLPSGSLKTEGRKAQPIMFGSVHYQDSVKAQVEALGLSDVMEIRMAPTMSSIGAILSQARNENRHWLGHMWWPSKFVNEYDLVRLKQDPSELGNGNPNSRCAYPGKEYLTLGQKDLILEDPEIYRFFERYHLPWSYHLVLEDKIEEGYEAASLGNWFLCQYKIWHSWVESDDIIDRVNSGLKCPGNKNYSNRDVKRSSLYMFTPPTPSPTNTPLPPLY